MEVMALDKCSLYNGLSICHYGQMGYVYQNILISHTQPDYIVTLEHGATSNIKVMGLNSRESIKWYNVYL